METADKMYLVPQHQLNRLKAITSDTENVRKTVENDLDETMRHILSRSDLTPYEKAKLYASSLQRFLSLVKQGDEQKSQLTLSLPVETENNPVTDVTRDHHSSEDDVVKEVVGNVAARTRKNASYIMEKISKSSDVASWNDKGEFIFKGKTIKGSHMLDLVKNLTAPQKVSDDRRPLGWSEMLQAVAGLNMPFSAIPNVGVRRKISDIKKSEYLFSPAASTPPSSKSSDSDSSIDTFEPVFKSPSFNPTTWLNF
nr:TPA_asm: acintoc2 [Astyanax tetra cavefish adintovirus]